MNKNTPFEIYKDEFKEETGKNWNESLSDYIAYLQLKIQEVQLSVLKEFCDKLKK